MKLQEAMRACKLDNKIELSLYSFRKETKEVFSIFINSLQWSDHVGKDLESLDHAGLKISSLNFRVSLIQKIFDLSWVWAGVGGSG